MCFAFFIATGSFFLGQQDVLPQAVRGSPILFVLAFAPFAVMAFWLVRVRFAKAIARLKLSRRLSAPQPQPGSSGMNACSSGSFPGRPTTGSTGSARRSGCWAC